MFLKPPRCKIHIGGTPVEILNVENRFQFKRNGWKEFTRGDVIVKAGLSSVLREKCVSGFYLYWHNCLISPLFIPIDSSVPQYDDYGIVGAAELSIPPANNKQEFDPRSPTFGATMHNLRLIYEKDLNTFLHDLKVKARDKRKRAVNWVACTNCRFDSSR